MEYFLLLLKSCIHITCTGWWMTWRRLPYWFWTGIMVHNLRWVRLVQGVYTLSDTLKNKCSAWFSWHWFILYLSNMVVLLNHITEYWSLLQCDADARIIVSNSMKDHSTQSSNPTTITPTKHYKVPQDLNLQEHLCENLKYYNIPLY